MLSHLSLGVRDLGVSGRFYDAVLAPLGYVRVWGSDRGVGYGEPGGNDRLALFPHPGAVVAAGPGFHLALRAPDPSAVDGFHAAALANGGTSAGPPGLRAHYGPRSTCGREPSASWLADSSLDYAAFVLDPDGHKLEAVHQ